MKCLTVGQIKKFLEDICDDTLVLISTESGIGEQAHELYLGIKIGDKDAILIHHNENEKSSLFE